MLELKSNDRSIASFTMLGHGMVHWFETAIPIFLVVWLGAFDISVAMLGLIVALGYAPFGLGALPAGILADRYGPKRLVLFCLAAMSGSFLLLSLANSISLIAVGLICWGIGASVYHPAGLALISTGVDDRGTVFAYHGVASVYHPAGLALISTGVDDRGTVFAYHGIAGNAGIALGPFVAATLLIFLEWQLVAALLAIPGLIGVVYGLRADFDPAAAVDADSVTDSTDPISLSALASRSRALFASAFLVVFLIVTAEGLFYRGVLTYLPEILHSLPAIEAIALPTGLEGIESADYLYVGLLVIGMAGQYAGGKLTDRIAPARGLAVIFTALAVLALLFVPVAATGLWGIVILCGVLGFLLFAIQPFYQEAVAVYTPPEGRGLSYGYTYLGEFGLGAASIAIGGVVLGAFSLSTFFALLAGFALVGATLAISLLYARDRIDRWVTPYAPAAADGDS